MISIVPYETSWPEAFIAIARPLRMALGELALRIDHIGSTSVPGLAAKDVIDVQVSIKDFSYTSQLVIALWGVLISAILSFFVITCVPIQ